MKTELIFCLQNNGLFNLVEGSQVVVAPIGDFVEDPVSVTDNVPANYAYIPRHLAETNPNYRQVIPYISFYRDIDGVGHYLAYRRAKGSGENRLMGNISIGFGGHVELSDYTPTLEIYRDDDDFIKCTMLSIVRELKEELCINEDDTLMRLGKMIFDRLQNHPEKEWIVSNANEVGKVHVGLNITLDWDDVYGSSHDGIFENNREIDFIGFLSSDQIETYAKYSNVEVEEWTKAVLA